MVAKRYLALAALAILQLQGCIAISAATAFQHGPTPLSSLHTKSLRKSSKPTINSNLPNNRYSAQDVHSHNQHPLYATNDANQEQHAVPISKPSKRRRVLNVLGLRKISKQKSPTRTDEDIDDSTKSKEEEFEKGPFQVSTIDELNDYFEDKQLRFRKKNDEIDYNTLLASLSVKGDTQLIGSPDHKHVVHPVVHLLHERRKQIEKLKPSSSSPPPQEQTNVTNSKRSVHRTMPPNDGYRIALSVEGGGMRGCVTAGMVTAIHYLGLEDTIDVVYGSSAGTIIGSYFITRQLPWFGPELYYDALTTAGDSFINTKRFLRALGLGLLDPRLIKDVIFRRNHGKPVLDLSYLLNTTMQENKPLDWDTFEEMQKVQPLKVIASGLKSEKAVVLDMERGAFSNIKELACCMRASCLLPGVAGPVMNMISIQDENGKQIQYEMNPRNNLNGDDVEPLADALLYEPLPYRAAIKDGATHVICLRSRPDGVDVTGKSSIFEKLIIRRFLIRKNHLRKAYEYMKKQYHKKLYAEQVIELNKSARDTNRPYSDTSKPHILPVAVPPGSPEVTRLETSREAIFEGVRRGFARCYDALVEDPNERGRGIEVAKQVFPDDILEYDPLVFTSQTESAYDAYLKVKELANESKVSLHPSNDA